MNTVRTLTIIIITGSSGSGKSTAMAALEDVGFYCVDNMPVALLPRFLELPIDRDSEFSGLAFVMDLREKGFLSEYAHVFSSVKKKGYDCRIFFLEASEKILLQRYSQTRRQHPLSHNKSLLQGIRTEAAQLEPLRKVADKVIDTSGFNVHELKATMREIVRKHIEDESVQFNVMSFGYKYGVPLEADLMVDVRFLTNPYFVPELKMLTGREKAVRDFILKDAKTHHFLEKYMDLLDFLIPMYETEGKSYLTIAVGCTGGRHRSVTVAGEIHKRIKNKGKKAAIIHRDIEKSID